MNNFDYLKVPKKINLRDISENKYNLSSRNYKKITFSNSTEKVRDYLNESAPYEIGIEPGSINYIKQSKIYFIRTKALDNDNFLIYPISNSIIPINPKFYKSVGLEKHDVLLSKDSSIGEVSVVGGKNYEKHCFSSGIVKLNITKDKYYLIGLLKHPFFKQQLYSKVPKGSVISHAKDIWLDCEIPIVNKKIKDEISNLVKDILSIEEKIINKNEQINFLFYDELNKNKKKKNNNITVSYLNTKSWYTRLDAGFLEKKVQNFLDQVLRYNDGFYFINDEEGFNVKRGQNLQESNIGYSIYSNVPINKGYKLIFPKNLSEHRTVKDNHYLANKNELQVLNAGDVIFGAEGFEKGRATIFLDEIEKAITNIHGIVFKHKKQNINESIFFTCYLTFLRSKGLIDSLAVGGSGGSFAKQYIEKLPIPKFKKNIKDKIIDLFTNSILKNSKENGIFELDKKLKIKKIMLNETIDKII